MHAPAEAPDAVAAGDAPHAGAGPIFGAAYFANFGALAAYGPFLAIYLEHRGLSAEVAAQLLASLLLVRVVATPAWSLLADKLASIGLVLRIVGVGAALSFAGILAPGSHLTLALTLIAFAAFRAPFGSLLDALVLRWCAQRGRAFGGVRAWGTAGYTIGAFVIGALIEREGASAVAYGATALLATAALLAFLVPRSLAGADAVERPQLAKPLAVLVRRPRFLLLLATATLHQVGLAPYDALFPSYVTSLSSASLAGASVAIGAGAELLFMMAFGPLVRRVGAGRLLTLAYAASAVRWGATALVTQPFVLVGLQVLHAFGFGAFYLSAVAIVDEESPPEVRASAQGLFGAFTWGIAAAAGLSLAGVIERHAGFRGVFGLASAASAIGTLVWIAVSPRLAARATSGARS